MMKISKLIEKFETDLLISSDSTQIIDDSNIIDAENEDIDIVSEENNVVHQEKQNLEECIELTDNT
jgi:hypothetical protein